MRSINWLKSAVPSKWTRYTSADIRKPERRPRLRTLGITALIALGILEQLEARGLVKPLHEMAHNSAEYLHTLIESLRFVYVPRFPP